MTHEFERQQIDTSKLPPVLLAKWTAAILEEGFVPFPKKFVRTIHRILSGPGSAKDIAVIFAIIDYKRPTLSRAPSLEYLAFAAGLPVDECHQSLESLANRSIIKFERTSEGLDIDTTPLLLAITSASAE